MQIISELAKFNGIKYYDEPHHYYRNGERYDSVTTLLHHFSTFDSDAVSKKVAEKNGITVEEVLTDWRSSGTKGTIVHDYIENYLANKIFAYPTEKVLKEYNGVDPVKQKVDKCIELVHKFCNDSSDKLISIKSELVVYIDYLKIAGMIDQVFFNKKSNNIEIWDWKTNKEIKTSNRFQKMNGIMSHLDDCNYNTYSLQLSMYKYIIEQTTDLKIGDLYLTWFNENNDNYVIYKCPYMADEIDLIINDRMSKM